MKRIGIIIIVLVISHICFAQTGGKGVLDSLKGRNEYLQFPEDSLEYDLSFELRRLQLTGLDDLVGRKEFFIYEVGPSGFLVGIKGEGGCDLHVMSISARKEVVSKDRYFVPFSKDGIQALFGPPRKGALSKDKEWSPFYSFFVRFKANGLYDVAFGSDMYYSDSEGASYSRRPFWKELGKLLGFLICTNSTDQLSASWSHSECLAEKEIEGRRIVWRRSDACDLVAISDEKAHCSDTLVYRRWRRGKQPLPSFSFRSDTLFLPESVTPSYEEGWETKFDRTAAHSGKSIIYPVPSAELYAKGAVCCFEKKSWLGQSQWYDILWVPPPKAP